MTEERLAEIEARAKEATPGPWFYGSGPYLDYGIFTKAYPSFGDEVLSNSGHSAGNASEEDGRFIAAARIDVPDLVAEVRKLKSELARRQ